MIIGELHAFRFTLFRVSLADPIVEVWGVGTIVDTGRDHDGYCGDWVRLRVLHGTYAFGEIVQCRPFDLTEGRLRGVRIFHVTPPREARS